MSEPTQGPGNRPPADPPQTRWVPPGWTPTPPPVGGVPDAPAPQTGSLYPDPRMQPPSLWQPPAAPVPPASMSWLPALAAQQNHTPGGNAARILALALALVVVFAVGFAAGGSPGSALPAGPTRAPATLGSGATPGPQATSGPQDTAGATSAPVPTADQGPGASVPPFTPADFGVFWQALKLVQDNYVDASKLTDQNLTWGAIRGMVDALGDTGHSIFLTPDDLAAENNSLNGHVSGIGVVVDSRTVPPTIVSVIAGSPAAGAGLKPGDLIVAVDGTNTQTLQPSDIVTRIRGQAGTSVTLSIQHLGSTSPVDVTIVRADVVVPASSWGMVPSTQIADVHVQQFSADAGKAARSDIQAAMAAGAKKIVLDLRGNPGGYVNEAVSLASEFLPEGKIVYEEQDRAGNVTPTTANRGGVALDVPLVVLTDAGTASAAEIVSGAIQGNSRGTLVGQKTFGTGTVLGTFTLSDGSAVRLGVREWLTPTGQTIFGKGITPDDLVALPADGKALEPSDLASMDATTFAASTDAQLLKAVSLLTTP